MFIVYYDDVRRFLSCEWDTRSYDAVNNDNVALRSQYAAPEPKRLASTSIAMAVTLSNAAAKPIMLAAVNSNGLPG